MVGLLGEDDRWLDGDAEAAVVEVFVELEDVQELASEVVAGVCAFAELEGCDDHDCEAVGVDGLLAGAEHVAGLEDHAEDYEEGSEGWEFGGVVEDVVH